MTDQYVPALRQRFLGDMQIKGLQTKTQTMYLRRMRDFTRFLGHAPDTATQEELRAFQLDMKKKGVGALTFNNRRTRLVWGPWRGSMGSVTLLLQRNAMGGARSDV